MKANAPNVVGGPLCGEYRQPPYFFPWFKHEGHKYYWSPDKMRWVYRSFFRCILDQMIAKYEPLTPENLLRKDRKNHGR